MDKLAALLDLEVRYTRALDLYDAYRIPILLDIDDTVFFASSRGEACRVLLLIVSWAHKTKISFLLRLWYKVSA